MEQLSGGEKTVAALALLFAIHRFVRFVGLFNGIDQFVLAINLLLSSSWTRWTLH